jgi:hypothetical protein
LKSTDVSEQHIASIFRVKEYAEQETSAKTDLLATYFHACFLLGVFDFEDGGDMLLRNFD